MELSVVSSAECAHEETSAIGIDGRAAHQQHIWPQRPLTGDGAPQPADGINTSNVKKHWYERSSIVRFWTEYINPTLIAQDFTGHTTHDPRDFYALERTHLAYIRTTNAVAAFGIVVAQLFILNNADSVHGRALAVCAQAIAIVLALYSGFRAITMQDKLMEGRLTTSLQGFTISVIAVLALVVAIFVVNLGL